MVLAAGAYALLYCVARFKGSRAFLMLAGCAYGVLAIDTAGLLLRAPIDPPWKLLMAVSALAYLFIPPVTWRYLQSTHREEGVHS